MTAKTTSYAAPALDRGLDILEYLSLEGVPLTQLEIAQGINKKSSEIYRMLMRLEERGYIIRGSNAGKYRLSLKMYELSHRHTPFYELKRAAHYPMQLLAEKVRESCHLSIMHKNQLLVISQASSPNPVSLSIEEGRHFPLSMTISGKVLLSCFSSETIKNILARDMHYKKWSKAQKEVINKEINEAKEKGYLFAESELTGGVTDIAIPIGSKGSEVSSVLGVSVFSSNLEKKKNLEDIINALKDTQKKINSLIGL
ncbi:IclR family transcriptional regulator [Flavivirga amylovorans]|uniref:IclR family transcriptional regulator n=1 Tax=Flavivirga amylovorans TaxID=870486 RepID=A0ABT8WWL6_9FLAO|nr:IclR family transcriptional regulator [Flavivirga amylovorans]MDO5985779.1 IclR family transcriptional regulator [Flavivirga amylovorans]